MVLYTFNRRNDMKVTDILEVDNTPMTDDELAATRVMVDDMKERHPVLYNRHKEYYDNLYNGISG